MQYKTRRMANGVFSMPCEWKELNPEMAESRTHIVICSDGHNRTAIYYSDVPANMLSDATTENIIRKAQSTGLGKDTNVYGFIENDEFNHTGARFARD